MIAPRRRTASYSKTDPDATFMRLKEYHMGNGQLKPAYNVQISSSNQFVVNRWATPYTIHSNTTNTNALAGHLEQHEKSFGTALKSLTADAGYGSEENYTLPEEKQMAAYVKYGLFDKRQNKSFNKKHPFSTDKLFYNPQGDHYICPMGEKMHYIGNKINRTATGFIQTARMYKASNYAKCPLNGACHKSKGNQIIQVNVNLEAQSSRQTNYLKVMKHTKTKEAVLRCRACLRKHQKQPQLPLVHATWPAEG